MCGDGLKQPSNLLKQRGELGRRKRKVSVLPVGSRCSAAGGTAAEGITFCGGEEGVCTDNNRNSSAQIRYSSGRLQIPSPETHTAQAAILMETRIKN